MGEEHDGTAGQGRVGEVLLSGGCQSSREMWSSKRSVGRIGDAGFVASIVGAFTIRLDSAIQFVAVNC